MFISVIFPSPEWGRGGKGLKVFAGRGWIVDIVVQSTAFMSLNCLSSDEVAHVYHIAQLADITCRLHSAEEVFRLFI